MCSFDLASFSQSISQLTHGVGCDWSIVIVLCGAAWHDYTTMDFFHMPIWVITNFCLIYYGYSCMSFDEVQYSNVGYILKGRTSGS